MYVQQPGVDKERGKYDQYHAYLDKLQMDREQRQNNPQPGMDWSLGVSYIKCSMRSSGMKYQLFHVKWVTLLVFLFLTQELML